MQQIFHRSASFALAFLVLLSTVSFAVGKHFCGDILVDQAVFSEVKSCGMHGEMPASAEDDCCEEEVVLVEGQKELKITFDDLDLEKQIFLAGFSYSYLDVFAGKPQVKVPFFHYKPPLLVYDLHLLDETFLI